MYFQNYFLFKLNYSMYILCILRMFETLKDDIYNNLTYLSLSSAFCYRVHDPAGSSVNKIKIEFFLFHNL